jgi:tetratricopeptide (TPR) repeat protein
MRILKSGYRSLYLLSLAGAVFCFAPGQAAKALDGEKMPTKNEAPADSAPSTQAPAVKAPVKDAPAMKAPAVKTPVVNEAPAAEKPAVQTPAVIKTPTKTKAPIVKKPVVKPDNVPPPGYTPVLVKPDNVPPPGAPVKVRDDKKPAVSKPLIIKAKRRTLPDSDLIVLSKAHQNSLLGSYLAGRVARGLRDHDAAAKYFGKALHIDPDSDILLEQTFVLQLARGNWANSIKLAKQVIKKGGKHRFSRMVLGLQAVLDNDYGEAERQFSLSEQRSPLGKMIGIIAEAWLHQAKGESQKALDGLARLDSMNWSKFYQDYHRAMIADQAGRHSLARKTYQGMFEKDSRSLRLMEAYVRHLSATGASKKAVKLMAEHIKRNGGHPLIVDLQQRVLAGEQLIFITATPREGLSELYYGIGDALTGDGGVDLGMIYLQAGLKLRPDLPLASLALAEAYEESKHFAQANRIYEKIGKDSPLWPGATVRRAFNLNSLKKVDEAKESLDELITLYPKDITAAEAQGNILRAHKRYGEAATYYSKAINLLETPAKFHWKYYYSRGVCFERLKNWKKAEIDLLQAHKLDPDQALVLNYLGYSWVDQGLHLNKAMRFIRRAVELKPDDGYFVDSLGWAHYRLRNYKKASVELERAVELKPDDPVINDHLGDAYWRVGRKLEAQFQWAQSLTLKPEEKDAIKIKAKLKDGMKKPKAGKALAIGPGNVGGLKKTVVAAAKKSADRVHVVRSGESLWTISKRYYGKGELHRKLIRANRGRLLKGDRITPGLRLIIPPLR